MVTNVGRCIFTTQERGFIGSSRFYSADSFADGQPSSRPSVDRRTQLRLTYPADTSEGKHAEGMRSELNASAYTLAVEVRGPEWNVLTRAQHVASTYSTRSALGPSVCGRCRVGSWVGITSRYALAWSMDTCGTDDPATAPSHDLAVGNMSMTDNEEANLARDSFNGLSID